MKLVTASNFSVTIVICTTCLLPMAFLSTDNGTQFTSNEFESFMKKNGIRHHPLHHPSSNGLYGSRERHFFHCLPHDVCFRIRRIISTCGESFPHAETRVPCAETGVPRAEECLRMRRLVFRVRRTVSACGDSCSACGGPSPHAETRVPRAENRFPRTMRTPLFRVRRNVSACGDSCSACGESFSAYHADTAVPRAEKRLRMWRFVFRMRRLVFRVPSPHAEKRLRMWRFVFRVRRNVSACGDSCSACRGPAETCFPRAKFRMLRKRQLHNDR